MNTKTTRITPAQVDEQLAVCQKIHAYWTERNTTPKAYVETYGCQQNEADSERIRVCVFCGAGGGKEDVDGV